MPAKKKSKKKSAKKHAEKPAERKIERYTLYTYDEEGIAYGLEVEFDVEKSGIMVDGRSHDDICVDIVQAIDFAVEAYDVLRHHDPDFDKALNDVGILSMLLFEIDPDHPDFRLNSTIYSYARGRE